MRWVDLLTFCLAIGLSIALAFLVGVTQGGIRVTKGEMVCAESNSYRAPPVWSCENVK